MKKYFVFSDVHGFYDELMEALNKAGFDIKNKDHIIVSCGDLFDRGPKPVECAKFVNSLPNNRKLLIEGNHEVLLKELCRRRAAFSYDHYNGTANTLIAFANDTVFYNTENSIDNVYDDCINNKHLKKYLKSLKYFCEIPGYIFVHGWLPRAWFNEGTWRDFAQKNSSWVNIKYGAMWLNGMEEWKLGHCDPDGNTVVCGHWMTEYGHNNFHNENVMPIDELYKNREKYNKEDYDKKLFETTKPFIDDKIVCLDTTTVVSHRVNVYVIDK